MSSIIIFLPLFMLFIFQGCNSSSENDSNQDDSHKIINIEMQKHISLPIGIKQKLRINDEQSVYWESNNTAVQVDQKGNIYAPKEKSGTSAQATITATARSTCKSFSVNVTIVNWSANVSTLTMENPTLQIGQLFSHENSRIYYTYGVNVYSSDDALETSIKIGEFQAFKEKATFPCLVNTQEGQFIRVKESIYHTDNFINYKEVLTSENSKHATKLGGLKSAFTYDKKNKYIYAGEYSIGNHDNTHAVYQGKVTDSDIKKWKKVIEFDSRNKNTVDSVRHIHVVTVDPYTNRVWIGTGDTNEEARLYYSDTNGENFTLFAIGSQNYRTLAIWFTKDYVYWNKDSASYKQMISRVKRTKITENTLTPKLAKGKTKVGVNYYVYSAKEENYFPASVHKTYTETKARTLSKDNIVYAIDDPEYDYREVVAKLANTAHWFHLIVKNDVGDEIIIMCTSAETSEPFSKDNRPRIFGIKERADGSVDTQELFSLPNIENKPYAQLVPYFQDEEGYIYFRGRHTSKRIYKGKLHWKDN